MDPSCGRDEIADLFIQSGRLAAAPAAPPSGVPVFDAYGLVVVPGFIDLHVHLREPGGEEAETIETGSRAAARGGFTTIVAMPNTRPPLDTPERVAWVAQRAEEVGLVRVIPAACATRGRAGAELTDFAALRAAGAGAFTDDGTAIRTVDLLRRALAEAGRLGLPVMEHAEDPDLERAGVMHAGEFSKRLRLPGVPAEAEVRLVQRDIAAAEALGAAVHLQHVSAADSVRLIRKARGRGVRVTGEATPHHLALTDADVDPANASFKMNPPLRSAADRAALLEAIADGTLQAFATDHAPHPAAAKARGFLEAPAGVVGLETAVGVTYIELVLARRLTLAEWVQRWTAGPAAILGLPAPGLQLGASADVTVLDLEAEWTVEPAEFASRSRNTPFAGRRLTGRALLTLSRGRSAWVDPRGQRRLLR